MLPFLKCYDSGIRIAKIKRGLGRIRVLPKRINANDYR